MFYFSSPPPQVEVLISTLNITEEKRRAWIMNHEAELEENSRCRAGRDHRNQMAWRSGNRGL